jgi:hypothetical protein
VAGIDEQTAREASVAELRIDRSASGAAWMITSRDRLIDQAIAETLPSQRHGGLVGHDGFVRTVLVDEIAIRIEDADSIFNSLTPLKGQPGQCSCHESGNPGRNGKFGCLCGCHSGTLCREAIVRSGSGAGIDAALRFSLFSAPAVGPLLMRSDSWGFCLSLWDLTQYDGWGAGAVEARIKLHRKLMRTRSGTEVVLAQPLVRLSGSETLSASYELAA